MWVVAVFEGPEKVVSASGPYRNKAQAMNAVEAIERLEDKVMPWAGWCAQPVKVGTLKELLEKLAEQQQ